MGKCPECGMWNSLVETVEKKSKVSAKGRSASGGKPQKLSEIKISQDVRTSTGFIELDRVLGGGLLNGSVILLSGDPGIGKSTLLLQMGLNLSQEECVLYVSGEESAAQIKTRALRLHSGPRNNLYISSETLVEEIVDQISQVGQIGLIIIDSIQTIQSEDLTGAPGSVGQIRECTRVLTQIAKKKGITLFLIGHVTKEGTVAGPMVLSHMVDTVLFLEGEEFRSIRVLRTLKNRFGPIDEVGVFEMTGAGIKEVKNPSDFFLGSNGMGKKNVPGSVVVASVQGSRPILVEVQALVVPSKLVVPRRVVSGADFKRVELLCAVLQKICKLPLDRFDIFINIVGGLVLREPGIDLGITLAIFSSFKGKMLPGTVAIAEVGLLGELRAVAQEEKRVNEAKKLGFKNIITHTSFSNLAQVTSFYGKKN